MKKISFVILMLSIVITIHSQEKAIECARANTAWGEVNWVCDNNPWVLVFEDNFDGNALDQTKWQVPYQGVLNDFAFANSKQWIANSGTTPSLPLTNNVDVSNGTLKLILRKEATPIQGTFVTDWSTNPATTQTSSFDYSTGWLESKELFNFGKFEIRCKIPKGKGFFPAFWTYGDPNRNEIDVFEFWNEDNCIGNYDANRLARNPHFNYHKEIDGVTYACQDKLYQPCENWNGPDYSADFHTFTITWDFYKIEWFIDGVLKKTVTKFTNPLSQQNVDCWELLFNSIYARDKAFPWPTPQKMIIDFAIKPVGQGGPDGTTPTYSEYEIDYIRYYQRESCSGDKVYNNTSELGLSSTVYNTKVGNTITLQGNILLPADQQLNVLAKNSIELKPGFETVSSSVFETKIDPTICGFVGLMPNSETENLQLIDFNKLEQSLDLNEVTINSDINIYPNPTEDIIYLEFNDPNSIKEQYRIVLTDYSGRNLMSISGGNILEIDLSNFNSGIYFLKVYNSSGKELKIEKVVKN